MHRGCEKMDNARNDGSEVNLASHPAGYDVQDTRDAFETLERRIDRAHVFAKESREETRYAVRTEDLSGEEMLILRGCVPTLALQPNLPYTCQ